MSNRAERRRQERAKRKGEKVLQVKRSDLDKLYEDALKDVSKKTVPLVLYASLEVLRTKYGFGRKRLKAFAEYVFEIYDGLNRDYVGFDDIAEAIQKETGIDLVGTDDGFRVKEGKKDGYAS